MHKLYKYLLPEMKKNVLPWQPNFPDLISIKHLYNMLDQKAHYIEPPPNNLQQLKNLAPCPKGKS